MNSIRQEAQDRFGFDMRTGTPEERSRDLREMLAGAPMLHDIARGGDVPVITDLLIHALDSTMDHVLGHIMRLDDSVSSRAVTMIAFMELSRMISLQYEALSGQLPPLVAHHIDAYISTLPAEQAKEIEQRAGERAKELLTSIFDKIRGGR